MRQWFELGLIGLGGGLGAMLRFGLSALYARAGFNQWPWATLSANLSGSFMMGMLVAFIAFRCAPNDWAIRAFWGIGLLGGFTTFSAFSIEMVGLIERKTYAPALAYALFSVLGAILACFIGLIIGRKILA